MAMISKTQGVADPRLTGQVAETTRPQPDASVPQVVRETDAPQSTSNVGQPPVTDSAAEGSVSPQYVQEAVKEMQKAIDQASSEPHKVGFRQDPETDDYVIEIRNPKGELIKQFPPEKVLNLHQRMDDLSGMVFDQTT